MRHLSRKALLPNYGQLQDRFDSRPRWRRLRELGIELGLDTGDPDDISALWTVEFSALTTNNTLLNREIQTIGARF